MGILNFSEKLNFPQKLNFFPKNEFFQKKNEKSEKSRNVKTCGRQKVQSVKTLPKSPNIKLSERQKWLK